ncbi:MAG: sensor domain-containing diguanylate cyclase [Vallitalea sp.]|jgi:diguanylate cyclase (GGDEF)-like protein|nr:sensor domain-containing diguanylate cyclase [Vallitalea sp.]
MKGKIEKYAIKIIIKSIIIVLGVFSISLFIAHRSINKKIYNNFAKQIYLKSQIVNKEITNIYENNMKLVDAISENKDIKIYLKEVKNRQDIKTNDLYSKLSNNFEYTIQSNNIHSIWIANEQANFIINANHDIDMTDYDIYKRPWRQLAVDSQTAVLTSPYIEYGTTQKVISIVKAIRDNNKIIGYIGVNITYNNLENIMKKNNAGKDGMNFLVDNQNKYIYSHLANDNDDDIFRNLLLNRIGLLKDNSKSHTKIKHNEKFYNVYYNKLNVNNWGNIQLINEEEIKKEQNSFFLVILVIFSVTSILLLVIIIYERITYKLRENVLKEQARIDIVTGTNNRSYFMEQAMDEFSLAKRQNRKFNVLIIDIDYFKSINDNYGHHIGDIVLENMAKVSVQSLGENAIFGRLGGEEFAAIILDVDEEEALLSCNKLREAISGMYVITEKGNISINVSIGLTSLKKNDMQFHDILKRADEAMYEAKNNGRNKVKLK